MEGSCTREMKGHQAREKAGASGGARFFFGIIQLLHVPTGAGQTLSESRCPSFVPSQTLLNTDKMVVTDTPLLHA